ncbi:MAG: molybdate ABC transporter permease subunit [Chlorobi bacterium]|nr:molybdate ABC transporter permease subunit [Chlorobiota bacterium]
MDFFSALTLEELQAIGLSVRVAIICSAVVLPLAIIAGHLFARKEFVGKTLIESIVNLPLVLPPVSTGFILLIILGSQRPIGKFLNSVLNIDIAFSFYAAVIAAIVVSFPLALRSIKIAMELVDPKLEEAAFVHGASKTVTFFKVTLPLAFPGLISGFVISFARSMGEFGATIAFAGNIPGETQTIPLAIFSYMQVPGMEMVAIRLALFSIVISTLSMVAAELFNKRMKKLRNR